MSHPTADEEISKYQRSDLSLKKWDLRLKAATFFTAAL
jgi:hypothetical protein